MSSASASRSSTSPGATRHPSRSRACLHCRRRKMKCDGNKPACQQCIRADRATECEYDDGSNTSGTQSLYEKLARLEMRLRELQGPRPSRRGEKASSGSASGSEAGRSPTASSPSTAGILPSGNNLLGIQLTSDLDTIPVIPSYQSPADISEPPADLQALLFVKFAPHAQQCGFSYNLDRFYSLMQQSTPTSGPPATLRYAIWLWGAHFSGVPRMQALKATFLRRAIESFESLLQNPSGLLDAVQAAVLLSTYLFAHGRMIEGAYHANTAALLATSVNLHRLIPPTIGNASASGPGGGMLMLPSPLDSIEWGERLQTFWNVYVLERTWSAASGFTSQRWDSRSSPASIVSPWPADVESYSTGYPIPEQNQLTNPSETTPIAQFLSGQEGRMNSRAELRAKAATLFEYVARLVESRTPESPVTPSFSGQFGAIQAIIFQFKDSLLPLIPRPQRGASFGDCSRFTTHAMTFATIIRMHRQFAFENVGSREKCLYAAHSIAEATSYLAIDDYEFLEPIIISCWSLSLIVLIQENQRIRSLPAQPDDERLHTSIQVMFTSLQQLGTVFPLAAAQAAKLRVNIL